MKLVVTPRELVRQRLSKIWYSYECDAQSHPEYEYHMIDNKNPSTHRLTFISLINTYRNPHINHSITSNCDQHQYAIIYIRVLYIERNAHGINTISLGQGLIKPYIED